MRTEPTPTPRRPNPLHRSMEVVVVTRAAIDRDGWPELWPALREKAEEAVVNALKTEGEPDYHLRTMSLGELVQASYSQQNLAFFRKGAGDRSCLVAQAWT